MTERPILHLNLKRKWFDMVKSEEKWEEYRALSPYWCRVFSAGSSLIKIKGKKYWSEDVDICFSNGYAKDREQIIVPIIAYRIGYGKPEWGAPAGERVFIIHLGRK